MSITPCAILSGIPISIVGSCAILKPNALYARKNEKHTLNSRDQVQSYRYTQYTTQFSS